MSWDFSHGGLPRWVGPMPMTAPTLLEQPAYGGIVRIETDGDGGVALTTDGRVLGFGDMKAAPAPPDAGYVQVAPVMAYNPAPDYTPAPGYVALTADGHLKGFGITAALRAALPTTGGFVQIARTPSGLAALTADGHVVSIGDANLVVPSGGGHTQLSKCFALTGDGHVVSMWPNMTTDNFPSGGGYVCVVTGGSFSFGMALAADGTVTRFGNRYSNPPVTGKFSALFSGGNGGDWGLDLAGKASPIHVGRQSIPALPFAQVAPGGQCMFTLDKDGAIVAYFDSTASSAGDGTPIFDARFKETPEAIIDAAGLVTVHISEEANFGGIPIKIDWGDGTALTTVPPTTVPTDAFTHTYATGGPYTVRIGAHLVGGGRDVWVVSDHIVAHAVGVTPVTNQYVFTYDATARQFTYSPIQVYDTADSAWHNAELNVYNAGTSTWVK